MNKFFRLWLRLLLILGLFQDSLLANPNPPPKKPSYASVARKQPQGLRRSLSASSLRSGRATSPAREPDGGSVTLYHATTESAARAIVSSGVRVDYGGPQRDFGQGFYTTRNIEQARVWARRRGSSSHHGAILRFVVNRHQLESLHSLHIDDMSPEGVQRFLEQNRIRGVPADRVGFDTVEGPMLMNVREVMANTRAGFTPGTNLVLRGHQMSFHTAAGAELLNGSRRSILRVSRFQELR